ncbi:hypothetical protein CERSUDRAFT_126745 [Gelatoporia subvermispora B]|uniref:Uncharacterized protein n=1 Tax=Ceriporiopsis subvermispora (strain B) TaxID=914234 RepID=M2QKJ5_CERS8|nr:hypothetical protein CERSUDRAFT_126745 [Gelatoporia subvermispora B]
MDSYTTTASGFETNSLGLNLSSVTADPAAGPGLLLEDGSFEPEALLSYSGSLKLETAGFQSTPFPQYDDADYAAALDDDWGTTGPIISSPGTDPLLSDYPQAYSPERGSALFPTGVRLGLSPSGAASYASTPELSRSPSTDPPTIALALILPPAEGSSANGTTVGRKSKRAREEDDDADASVSKRRKRGTGELPCGAPGCTSRFSRETERKRHKKTCGVGTSGSSVCLACKEDIARGVYASDRALVNRRRHTAELAAGGLSRSDALRRHWKFHATEKGLIKAGKWPARTKELTVAGFRSMHVQIPSLRAECVSLLTQHWTAAAAANITLDVTPCLVLDTRAAHKIKQVEARARTK